jgi:hypothetical protein
MTGEVEQFSRVVIRGTEPMRLTGVELGDLARAQIALGVADNESDPA